MGHPEYSVWMRCQERAYQRRRRIYRVRLLTAIAGVAAWPLLSMGYVLWEVWP